MTATAKLTKRQKEALRAINADRDGHDGYWREFALATIGTLAKKGLIHWVGCTYQITDQGRACL